LNIQKAGTAPGLMKNMPLSSSPDKLATATFTNNIIANNIALK
jgi:hypothetical protein